MAQKPIEKKVVHAGRLPCNELDFVNGTKVRFHFVTKKDGIVLDDSRTWENKDAMEIIFGKKFKFEVWELCIQTMAIGEVASFKVKKSLTYNYPTVAKTLRDSFDPRRPKDKSKSQHMCSMMAVQMQGGLGYDDLNELMKDPSDLEFVIELLSVARPEEYNKEAWEMSPDEKLGVIPSLKEEGNLLYKAKDLAGAADKYSTALGMLEQLMLREKPHDEEWLKLRDIKHPLLLNLAQCKLSEQNFYPVIEHCTEVLEADPNNAKALFRRAKAHAGAWNPDEAKDDFHRVMKVDPTLESLCRKEIKKIEEQEKLKNEQDRQKYLKMF